MRISDRDEISGLVNCVELEISGFRNFVEL